MRKLLVEGGDLQAADLAEDGLLHVHVAGVVELERLPLVRAVGGHHPFPGAGLRLGEQADEGGALGHLPLGEPQHLGALAEGQGEAHPGRPDHRAAPLPHVESDAQPLGQAHALEGGVEGGLHDFRVGEGAEDLGRQLLPLGEVHRRGGRPVPGVGEQQDGEVLRLHVAVDAALLQVLAAVGFDVDAELSHGGKGGGREPAPKVKFNSQSLKA